MSPANAVAFITSGAGALTKLTRRLVLGSEYPARTLMALRACHLSRQLSDGSKLRSARAPAEAETALAERWNVKPI